MGLTVIWALLTGLITGGVWAGIVLFDRQRRIARGHADLLDEAARSIDQLDRVTRRLAEVEERMDFAERVIQSQEEAKQLPPSEGRS